MLERTHDILGGLSLAVWLAMVAVATFAWAALPDWHIPNGTGLPPPDGCYHEINVNLSSRRFVCRGTSADAIIEEALNYAVIWVAGIVSLPLWVFVWPLLLVVVPPLLFTSLFWLNLLPSALSFGIAASFAYRRFVRRRAWRAVRNPQSNTR